ncbi:MAG: hypothetical protein WCD49_13345 [Candidatus Acidiferrales bacterium]
MPAMADWRQIQARIRKAKNSPDAHAKLSELYQRTRDAMVAWELALIQEKAELKDDAVKWYTIAAERFRRAEWKKKAEEALTRLGAALPVANEMAMNAEGSAEEPRLMTASELPEEKTEPLALGEISEPAEGSRPSDAAEASPAGAPESGDAEKKKRRRGRRGGRGRRRKGAAPASGLPSQAFAEPAPSQSATPQQSRPPAPARQQSSRTASPRTESFERAPVPFAPQSSSFEAPEAPRAEQAAPMLPSERTAHGRAGDPALASRMSHLESMLRRLVASPLHRLDTEEAPAGPGVFLLSDSDQITSYYVEACQTLRVGVGNLARGLRGSAGKTTRGTRTSFDSGLKAKLAEHLGITEAKVSQYLKDHCVVRWIQLDDDAPHLAHFAIGVLRTPLNLD